MSSRQTRSQAAQARDTQAVNEDSPIEVVVMNGNGTAHRAPEASDKAPTENIFLFWPNIIGMHSHGARYLMTCPFANMLFLQATHELFLPSRRSTTCPSILAPARSSTASPAFSMPSMATPRDISISRLDSEPF